MEKLDGERVREGFLDPGDFYKILEHVRVGFRRDLAEFLYLSGWRTGKATEIEWKHLTNGEPPLLCPPVPVNADSTKQVGIRLPMTGRLADILAARRAARRTDCSFIFHNNGKQIDSFRKAWYGACSRAGYGKILPHDFRRSMMSNLTEVGVDLKTIMDRAGWKTPSTAMRYRIVAKRTQMMANDAYDQHIEKNQTAKVTQITPKN